MPEYRGMNGETVQALRLETEDTRPDFGDYVDELHEFLKDRVWEWEGDENGVNLYSSDEEYVHVDELEWIVAHKNDDGTPWVAVMPDMEFRAAYEPVDKED